MKSKLFFNIVLFLMAALQGRSEVSLPHVFGDNMVLQRDQTVLIWGWATPREKVTVEFSGQKRSVVTDKSSCWKVKLRSLKASDQPAELKISGANEITLTNVLVGDVWFCSGQSNMEKPVGHQPGQRPTQNYLQELSAANYPAIRLFRVDRTMAREPQRDLERGEWSVCSSNALEKTKFSAVAYFFGREIHSELNVPIGLIESSWGGTRIEPWTPPIGFEEVPALKKLSAAPGTNRLVNTLPTVLFNSMVAPVAPFAIRGALWYQGESNCTGDQPNVSSYTDKMEALVRGWREVWGEGDFPFYYVQIAPYHYFHVTRGTPSARSPALLPEFWEAQTRALRIRHTGMAVITDLVDNLEDIHPTQKKEVGQRLAWLALDKTYGKDFVASESPMFKSIRFSNGRAIVTFDHTYGKLASRDGQPLDWFTIAGADGKFVRADAEISDDKVIVSASAVPDPKAVRFAWDESAEPNLINRAGLPANSFRSDAP